MKPILICAASALLLTGCVQYDWYKDDTTREQKDRQLLSCNADAIRAVPPAYRVTGASTQTTGTNCNPAVQSNCPKHGHAYSNTTYNSVDMNENARQVLVKDCMYKMGYREIQINR
ncbi:MAG: hypothetical protein GAK37_03699 [Pseudomonas sp.]|nr:MAG: hypothetical protein GAK37_03699 [Pseudomonas sp.]